MRPASDTPQPPPFELDLPLRPTDWRSPAALLALRLSIAFVLEVSQISRGEREILDPLILTAMLEANQATIRHDPQLASRYGKAGAALPDDLRRPISISALAKSLRLPFENVRRRVRGFVDAGICVQTAEGVYVCQAMVLSAPYRAIQAARIERLRLFQGELAAAGLLRATTPQADLFRLPRAADRALAEYMLRTCDRLIALADGPVNGFVLLGLCALNGERAPALQPVALEEIAMLARARPATAIARRIGAPGETVRRHLWSLQALGLAERRETGWLFAPAPGRAEELALLVAENARDLRRLFARLGELAAAEAADPA